jgi:hypothetical protein
MDSPRTPVLRPTAAHLILVLDVAHKPPIVAYVRIVDTATPAVGMGFRAVSLHEEIGHDYAAAYAKVEHIVEHEVRLAWVRPYMRWSSVFGSRAKK